MEQHNTEKQPIVWNKYWISTDCLVAESINSIEYTLILGCTLCSIRYKDNKITEMYFYDRTLNNQILAIEENSYNTYTQIDSIITRDDGAIYEYTEAGLIRLNDNRVYTIVKCDPTKLDDLVYTAYYFMYNSDLLKDYKEKYMYNIFELDIKGLQALMSEINNYTKNDYAKYIKDNLFLKEY